MFIKNLSGYFVFPCLLLMMFDPACAQKTFPGTARFFNLNGSPQADGNPLTKDGNVHVFTAPQLRIYQASATEARGTILFFPDGNYSVLAIRNALTARSFTTAGEGFNLVIADYQINRGNQSHDLAIEDGLKAFRLLKQKAVELKLTGSRMLLMGKGTGGHLAAEVCRRLGDDEQPSELILQDPAEMGEHLTGTVLPAVRPPLHPVARLTLLISDDDSSVARPSEIYAKTWRGYDGLAAIVRHGKNHPANEAALHDTIFRRIRKEAAGKSPDTNPAEIPVEGYAKERHRAKCDSLLTHRYDLLMIGNSITNNFDKPEFQAVWQQYFASRNAINLGYSGYRTENILWNLDSGELVGQTPKVAVIEIGTNNVDEKNYPVRHTAGQLAGGITAIINRIRVKMPDTRIIVLRCFPGSYDGALPTSHRAILERASDLVSRTADNQHVFYCDVNHVFLNLDGSLNHDLMPDYLHPNAAGAKDWAEAMEPLLSKLMGDSSKSDGPPENTAIVPVPKLEEDMYNWWDRHAEVLRIKDSLDPEVVLIGNSITHFWGGLPLLRNANGSLRQPNGPLSFARTFGKYRVLNLGFGWDRTQNVLWRLDHGELDGLHPRAVLIDIGTNNTSQTNNARMNTAPEIVAGIDAICRRVRSKVPGAEIAIMAIFPREKDPRSPRRLLIADINRLLKKYAGENALRFIDIGPAMLNTDGTFKPGMMLDYTHPAEAGYTVWGDNLRDFLSKP